MQVAQATLAFKFAQEVADSNAKTLALFQTRFRTGAINEGDLARIETQKLESEQARDQAAQALRQSRVLLAFLIGVRGEGVADFDVDTKVLSFADVPSLSDATEESLLRTAFGHRPGSRCVRIPARFGLGADRPRPSGTAIPRHHPRGQLLARNSEPARTRAVHRRSLQ